MDDTWKKAQSWERHWHGNCINSYYEEQKQLVYAEKMGLVRSPTPKTPYNFDLKGASILDIGGGAYSLLLKCVNFENSCVIDPLMEEYPEWVVDRYRSANIFHFEGCGEELLNSDYGVHDEVWIYNVLEHTYDPKKIIENALDLGKIVRIFEWLDTPSTEGHPQTLRENELNEWLGGEGKVEMIDRSGTKGKCYYGVFKGNDYE